MQGHLLNPPSLDSTTRLLGTPGGCFYIPPYQRHFAWDKGDIERFFEAIVHGIMSMANSQPGAEGLMSESFMGTVVCFEDHAPYESIVPKVDNDYPKPIYMLIDGQQRLTICLALAAVLHNFLNKADLKNKELDEEKKEQFNNFKTSTSEELYKLLFVASPSGELEYYPRMIRGFDDCWSRTKEKSKYNSPISKLLSSYIDYVKEGSKGKFSFREISNEAHAKNLAPTLSTFVKWLSQTETGDPKATRYSFGVLPDIVKIFQENENMQKVLFGLSVSIDPFTPLQKKINESDGKQRDKLKKMLSKYKEVARIITFSTYFLKRLKFIQMVTTSTDYAFTIFDALNTTGDPLTAFETFKPEVMSNYSKTKDYVPKDYKQSPLFSMIDEVDKYFKVEKRKQEKKTKDLIVNFALAENGEKLSKALNIQRLYMINEYRKRCKDKKEEPKGKGFIKNLMNVARVNESFLNFTNDRGQIFLSNLEGRITPETYVLQVYEPNQENESKKYNFITEGPIWDPGDIEHKQLSTEAIFCLKFLAATGHTISIPLIARFYEEFLSSLEQKEKHKDLCRAIRSIAAFFVLWRISRPGMDTDNIDSHHRRIMDNSNNDSLPQLNFARNVENKSTPDFMRLQNEFCRIMVTHDTWADTDPEHKMESEDTVIGDETGRKLSKNKWINLAYSMPIYNKQKEVAKFILLLNAYWSKRDSNNDFFNSDLWFQEAHNTIEHILPQNAPIDISSIEEKSMLDAIGNLTLLPSKVNSWLQDKQWEACKPIYAVLSANDEETVQKQCKLLDLRKDDKEQLLIERKKIKELYHGHYLPTIQSIASYEEFSFDQIRKRGKKILDSVWGPLVEWLGTDIYNEEEEDNSSEN